MYRGEEDVVVVMVMVMVMVGTCFSTKRLTSEKKKRERKEC